MYNFSYETQGTHTYLVYTVAEDDAIDSMSLGMLTNNKIHGLAHTLFTQMNTTKYIKYDVSSKISVKQFFSGQVNKKRLIGVFNGIVDAMVSAEDYMIDVNSIVLDLDYIFADVSSCETVLVCLPIISDDLSIRDLGAFFKNIMFTTQFEPTENCDYVAKIINYLNSSPVFSLTDFKLLLENIGGTAIPATVQQSAVQKSQPETAPASVQQSVQPKEPERSSVQSRGADVVHQPVQSKPIEKPVTGQQGMQIPPAQQETSEKPMTMMDLLTHYNKENAELYRRQQAAKKAGKMQTGTAPSAPPKAPSASYGFSIPGQQPFVPQTPAQKTATRTESSSAPFGFAIPGQQSSIPQTSNQKTAAPTGASKAGFAIPGQQPSVPQTPAQRVGQVPAQQPVVNRPAYEQPRIPDSQTANFGETTVLGGGGMGETTVLGATPAVQSKPYLIRAKNREKVELSKPVFRIGKERSYVDYFIGDNSAISRSHANIISRDGEYFVVDTNSTNHTYVDGQMIRSNVETKITHGTKLRFANEDFEFRLY